MPKKHKVSGISPEGPQRRSLDRAVAATRRKFEGAGLSETTRLQILDAAQHQAVRPVGLFPALFTAPRRLLAAGALPLLVAAGLLLVLNQRASVTLPLPLSGISGHSGSLSVEVSKVGDQVAFEIANGNRSHDVYRSTVPDRFESSTRVRVTDGSYVDPVEDQADLVFYRID